jgi:hypothetical protein
MILMDVVFKGNSKATKKLEKLKQDFDKFPMDFSFGRPLPAARS